MNSRIIISLMLVLLLVAPMVSAVTLLEPSTWDNYDKFIANDKYGRIEVWDKGQIGEDTKLTESILNFNTDQCLINCKSQPDITQYEEGVLIEDIRFLDEDGNEVDIPYEISYRTEEEYIAQELDEDKTKEICEPVKDSINGSMTCSTEMIYKDVTKTREIDVAYKLGDDAPAGTFPVTITAKKPKDLNVDWQIKIRGEWHDAWAWWSGSWDKRKAVNVTGGDVNLDNFPVAINVTYEASMQVDFDDIRFINGTCEGDQSNELFYEVNNKVNSEFSLFWVNIENLTTGVNELCMYYDNVVATNNEDSAGVFSNNYSLVFHSEESSGEMLDSTRTANATLADALSRTIDCPFGKCYNYTNGDYATTVGTETPHPAAFTIEIWAYSSGTPAGKNAWLFDYEWGDNVGNGMLLPNGATAPKSFGSTGGGSDDMPSGLGTNNGEWNLWTWIQSDGLQRQYINKEDGTTFNNAGAINYDADGKFVLATWSLSGTPHATSNWFGMLDEIRVSSVIRSSSYINRSHDNIDTSFVVFGDEEVDSGVVALQSAPVDFFNSTSLAVNISCNFSVSGGSLLDTVTLLVYDSSDNLDFSNTDDIVDATTFNKTWTSVNLTEDVYNWACAVVGDGLETDITTNRTLNVHETSPQITIDYPTGIFGQIDDGSELQLNWTIFEGGQDLNTHIKNCSYTYNSISVNLNQSNCTIVNTTFFTYATGINTISMTVTDGFNLRDTNVSTWETLITENNQTFNESTFETASETFVINITYNETLFVSSSAMLNYDGVQYSSTRAGQLFTRELDIPIVESDETVKQFFWSINLFNGTSSNQFNSTAENQEVNNTFLDICNATLTTKSLNFTARDETEDTRINPYVFQGSLEFWLGTGSIRNNMSTQNITANETNLCIYPDREIKVTGIIAYNDEENSTTYNLRNYYFQNDAISSTLQHIPLYLLKSSLSTSFILRVQDIFLLPLEDYLIVIEKFFPGEGVFKIVQIALTDENGKTVGFFQTETVDYRFIITNEGVTHLTTGIQKVIGEEVPFTLTFTIGDNSGGAWQDWEEQPDLTHTLGPFNSSANTIKFSYEDTSTDFTKGFLEVTKINQTGLSDTTICDLSSVESSAIITCDTGNETGTYSARGLIQRGSDIFLIDQVTFQIFSGDISETAGLYGVFLGWFLILVSAFAFKFNEIAGIWLMNAAVIAVNVFKLIVFSPLYITAMLAGSIIITGVIMKRRVQ